MHNVIASVEEDLVIFLSHSLHSLLYVYGNKDKIKMLYRFHKIFKFKL